MLKLRSPQNSFYGDYLYDKIVPQDHLLCKINAVVDFSFVNALVKDRYTPDFGRLVVSVYPEHSRREAEPPAEDPEFMLRLCLLRQLTYRKIGIFSGEF